MNFVVEGHMVQRFVPAEDDAVAVAIDEPYGVVEKDAVVGGRFRQRQQRLGASVDVHVSWTPAAREKFPKNHSSFSANQPP